MNRLIDADTLWRDITTAFDDCEDILEIIDRQPTIEPEQRWIPVTDRLPEEETDVLVCNANGDIEISSGSYSTEVKDFIWYTSGWRFGKVIAWMPLPTPWKGEENE